MMGVKFVITGGPCSGKTDLVNELDKEFFTIGEAARLILVDREYSRLAQYDIFEKQLKQLLEADRAEGRVFMDRGIPDSMAYFRYHFSEVPEEVEILSQRDSTDYKAVFILDRLPYKKDELRNEDEENAEEIHTEIVGVYRSLGYNVVQVPRFSENKDVSLRKRVEFVRHFAG